VEGTAAGFRRFFQKVHGTGPFPWQVRLAEQALAGPWPQTIELPTSFGKTAVIDIAVFALAAEAGAPARERRTPRRIFYVVDRRIVVDQAYERARALAEALRKGTGLLREVAQRLQDLAGGEGDPLRVLRLRGGIYRDEAWFSPAQPLVCATTVDQFGSRLLFRGYGVRDTALSVQAALLGNDALVVLDEAHLSWPLWDTLRALRELRAQSERPLGPPWVILRMSATAADHADGGRWGQDEAERGDNLTHEVLGPRIRAAKQAKLVEVSGEDAFLREVVERARSLTGAPEVEVVGVILNRVDYARRAFEALRSSGDVLLLTGRARPLDRDRLLDVYGPRILAPKRAALRRQGQGGPAKKPLFVVATQCVEVGADLDFDAIVTQSASLDALRQRFGRQDRFGRLGMSAGCVVHLKGEREDPVYGVALANTWKWLNEVGGKAKEVDFGVAAMGRLLRDLSPERVADLCSPRPRGPLLLPHFLDAWSQTSPRPGVEPSLTPFLHGWREEAAELNVVWRADLSPSEQDSWTDIVSLHPPSALEAMQVPLYAVARWLRESSTLRIADVEGAVLDDRGSGAGRKKALRWLGPEESEVVDARGLRPGDTLVVPSIYGGADRYGWYPEGTDPVEDVGDLASFRRGRAVLRLRDGTTGWLPEGHPLTPVLRDLLERQDLEDDPDPLVAFLKGVDESPDLPRWVRRAARRLRADARRRLLPYPDGRGWVVRSSRRAPSDIEFDEDDLTTQTYAGHPVRLEEHSGGVARHAQRLARLCGLPDGIARDLALAGWLHDVGKADPRFQAWLHGGEELQAMGRPLLAKSGMDPNDRRGWEEARSRAAYPRGGRHEALSVALVAPSPTVRGMASDPDLVLHLIGSHHGRARPFFPPVPDPETRPVSFALNVEGAGQIELRGTTRHGMEALDSGVGQRFWKLTRRYGWYGLAYLEALLRLADWQRSEEEEG